MARFSDAERAACSTLVELALREDLQTAGDLTCEAVIPPALQGAAAFVARSEGVVAGLPVAEIVYQKLTREDAAVEFQPVLDDGARLRPGAVLARVRGNMRIILVAERTILNFLQRLSGIASLTRRFVDIVARLPPAQILDTRKTTPGWRLLEKYAVRCGGGHNHRVGLYDGVLIKDNHLAALARSGGTVTLREAVTAARARYGTSVLIEVEVDTLEQLDEALACSTDVILLDNMKPDQLRTAIWRRNQVAPRVLLEASGGVSLKTIAAIAGTGVDRISVGALTHSAPALDIGLDYEMP